MDAGQSDDTTTGDSLKLKQKTRIACWNVRTRPSKLREFQNYGLDILGVCEAR